MKYFNPLFLMLILSAFTTRSQIIPDFSHHYEYCPDLGRNIHVLDNWDLYQTTNGEWDGPRTGKCFEYVVPNCRNTHTCIRVAIADIDTLLPIFIKPKFTSQKLLDENGLYKVSAYAQSNDTSTFKIGSNCIGGMCSGLIVRVQIPDSTGDSIAYREYLMPGNAYSKYLNAEGCMATEKFLNQNFLEEIILKISAKPVSINDTITIHDYSFYIDNLSYYSYIFYLKDSVSIPAGNGRVHPLSTYDLNPWGYNNYIVQYSATTYPSPSHFSFTEFIPNPNPSSVDTVEFTIMPDDYLTFQPYTEMIGAHPNGDSLNRHVFRLINNGADICMYALVEKVFQEGDQYVHKAGNVNFSSPQSCFAFGKGGALVVADGATFHYGGNGRGMMALRTGGTIILGKNSELIIHGHINIFEYAEDIEPQQIYMTLNESSRLIFAEGSRLTNMYSKDNSIKLNVYMNGGILDDSGLPLEDRYLINRIYSGKSFEETDQVRVKGNPVSGNINLSYVSSTDKDEITIELLSVDGRSIFSQKLLVNMGTNNITLPASQVSKGFYLLRILFGNESAVKKVIML